MLVIDEIAYIANTGDSRAVISYNGGTKFDALTEDHKPSEEAERVRILKAGGQIY
jgi:serine/threonine protein phosphatase PrpC